MSSFKRIAVIMAGGTGERFWPLSRAARPKQLLRLTRPELSLLEEAIERIAPLVGHENILIATSSTVAEPIRAALTGSPISPDNVIVEPAKRNTAGALAWVAANVKARFGSEPVSMAVLTADHAIGLPDRFREVVAAALTAAEQEGALVTLGVTPTRPETGYGYIEVSPNPPLSPQSSVLSPIQILPVAAFREKPDRESAERFVSAGRFFWNSGMFFWRLDSFLDELATAAPAHGAAAIQMAEALAAGNPAQAAAVFNNLTDISIDYALMEKARRVLMVRADFPWDDVGAWDALARSFPADPAKNVAVGDPILIDTRNSIVYNEPGAEKMAVAAVGVDNLIIVVSADGVVVIPRDRAQDVKKIVTELKTRKATQL